MHFAAVLRSRRVRESSASIATGSVGMLARHNGGLSCRFQTQKLELMLEFRLQPVFMQKDLPTSNLRYPPAISPEIAVDPVDQGEP